MLRILKATAGTHGPLKLCGRDTFLPQEPCSQEPRARPIPFYFPPDLFYIFYIIFIVFFSLLFMPSTIPSSTSTHFLSFSSSYLVTVTINVHWGKVTKAKAFGQSTKKGGPRELGSTREVAERKQPRKGTPSSYL